MKSILAILFLFSSMVAQVYTQADVDVCESKFQLGISQNLTEEDIHTIIVEIAKSFLGVDYEAHSLESEGDEKLSIHLTGLDCYTFLESSLVISRLIKSERMTFDDYQSELQNVRYRNGKIAGYPSRLHYFSDWIFEMDSRGIAKDVTEDLGGECYSNKVDFMSTHPDSYKQLKNNSEIVYFIAAIEKDISARDYFFIPQEKIEKYEKGIMSGDIIGITTNINGLDIAHTGIAIRMNDGRIHLLHAPNVGKKVQITEASLAEYVKRNKIQTGIMVSRPLEP
ncbi:MAG: DUF1460 domain-containing protein [Bacteroidetes bacterium]|nr:DUF1460 domain-containing protein [Bacteroidota bacterium]